LRLEPEVAIRLAVAVAPGSSSETARGCIGALHPALEIVNYARPGSGLDDLIAHSMFHEGAVLGAACSLDAARGLGRDLPVLRVGSRSAGPPRHDLVPADFGDVVAFAAEFLAAFDVQLEPGDLILSGSYTERAVPMTAGEAAAADFGPLGSVSVTVVAQAN
jgi:2-keto-4-pentenoate hydratase